MSDAPLSIDPELLLRESRWLHGLARSLVHDEHEAEDVVQSAFLTAVTRPPRATGALRSWLAQVARRLAIRTGQQRQWRARREQIAARGEEQPPTVDVVGRASLHRSLVESVLELEEPYRTTVLLRYFEDVPAREIAARFDVPVATVHTRLGRALTRLRTRLDSAAGPEVWRSVFAAPIGTIAWAGASSGAAAGSAAMAAKAKVAAAAALVLIAGALGWRAFSSPDPLPKDEVPGVKPEAPARETEAPRDAAAPVPIAPRRFEEAGTVAPAKRGNTRTGLVVDDKTGEPIAGALVSAFVDLDDEQPESTVTTGADGRFEIESPRHPGLVLARLRVAAPTHVRWSGENRVSPQVSGNDVGTIRLVRGASVSGKVVAAGTAQPVTGATLFLYGHRGTPGAPIFRNAVAAGASGDDGAFTTSERLPPAGGTMQVLALHDRGLDWTEVGVTEQTGEVRDLEIVARAGYDLCVSVKDESGRPVEGATVMVVPRFRPLGDAWPALDWMAGPKWVPREGPLGKLAERFLHATDPAGVARFHGLPEPRLDPADRFPTVRTDVFAFKSGFDTSRVKLEAPATAGEASIVLRAHRSAVVLGSVRRADGSPLAGAAVSLTAGDKLGRPIGAARTNASGEYRIETDAPADDLAALSASSEGFSVFHRKVAIEPGKEARVDFALLPAAAITGRVLDENGKPVPGRVDATQFGELPSHLDAEGGGWLRPDGSFSIPGADARDWRLRIDLGREWEVSADRLVRAGDHVELVAYRAVAGVAALDAEIIDAATGKHVEALSAMLSSRSAFPGDGFHPPQPVLSPGHVRAERLSQGTWRLILQTARFGRQQRDFVVGPSESDIHLCIELGKPAGLSVRVVLDDVPGQSRPASVRVQLPEFGGVAVEESGKPVRNQPAVSSRASAANGWTCRFELVPTGIPLRVAAAGQTHAAETVVTLAPGEDRTVELRLAPAGKVRFEATKPVRAGFVLKLLDADGEWREIVRQTHETREPWSCEQLRRAGPLRYRVESWPLDLPARLRSPQVLEGETTIEAGKTAGVPVPVE